MTEAERAAIRDLAAAAIAERLGRAYIAETNAETGRSRFGFAGEPGPAETAWFALARKLAR